MSIFTKNFRHYFVMIALLLCSLFCNVRCFVMVAALLWSLFCYLLFCCFPFCFSLFCKFDVLLFVVQNPLPFILQKPTFLVWDLMTPTPPLGENSEKNQRDLQESLRDPLQPFQGPRGPLKIKNIDNPFQATKNFFEALQFKVGCRRDQTIIVKIRKNSQKLRGAPQ